MIMYVDYIKDEVSVIEIHPEKGNSRTFKCESAEKLTFDMLAQSLIINVLRKKPSQIIFDKTNNGAKLYDSFVSILKEIGYVKMESNGELAYK